MKFNCSVEIDLPRERVVELFDNDENMRHWQTGLVGIEHLSGTPRQEGAKSRLRFENGRQKFDLFETVRVRNLPDEYTGYYETPGICSNEMKNTFTALGENRTRFDAGIDYEFHGLMIRVMAFLMPGMFRKQVQNFLDNFKVFAESQEK